MKVIARLLLVVGNARSADPAPNAALSFDFPKLAEFSMSIAGNASSGASLI